MSLYESYLKNYPNMSNPELADLVLEQEDLTISRKSVLRGFQRARSVNEITITSSGRKGDSYVLAEEYEFRFGDSEFDIPRDQIAAACAWYCDPDGQTLSQVCERLWVYYKRHIDEDFLRRIFSCFGITKSSNGLAPHIVAEWSHEEISAFYLKVRQEKIDRKINDSDNYRLAYIAERKKTVDMEEFFNGIDDALSLIANQISESSSLHAQFHSAPTIMSGRDPVYENVLQLSDWHVGQCSEHFDKTKIPEYIERIIEGYASAMERRATPPEVVHVLCLGDMTDGPLGNMRPEQQLQQDLHHEEQVAVAATGIAEIVAAVRRITGAQVFCHGVGGNHDRTGPDRNDDPTRFGAKMVYLLSDQMSRQDNGVHWTIYNKVINHFMSLDTQVLFRHGDRGGKDYSALVWANKVRGANHFVVADGHYHSVKAEEIKRGIYHFRGGSFPGADEYASSLGFSSRPAQIMWDVYETGPHMPHYLPLD